MAAKHQDDAVGQVYHREHMVRCIFPGCGKTQRSENLKRHQIAVHNVYSGAERG